MAETRPQISDLVAQLSAKSDTQSLAILQRLTNLFLEKCNTLSEKHISVFDEIMCTIIERAPFEALVELSAQLVSLDNAPINVVGRLVQHDDIAVAGPRLKNHPGSATSCLPKSPIQRARSIILRLPRASRSAKP